MIRKLSNYGLKQRYDFKEIHVPTTQQLPDIHNMTPAFFRQDSVALQNPVKSLSCGVEVNGSPVFDSL